MKLFKRKGIKPSYHRIKIYEYLVKNNEHPTVDIIYRNLVKEIPNLSKTTVYNTLHLFKRKGLVQELTIEENEARFDARIDFHAHFKCLKCGKIYDVETNNINLNLHLPQKAKITEIHFYIKGICPNCLEKGIEK